MFCMFSVGFGLQYFASNPAIAPLAKQFEHTEWHGMTFWDLIQPFFMFIVGAVMPVSFGRRWQAGEAWSISWRHVLRRALLLAICGEVARVIQARALVLDIINVLAQLAFTYPIAFLTLRRGLRFQAMVAFGLLAAHWALYRFGAAPGVTGPWDPDANMGWYLDGLVLHKHWGDHFGYATINCVSSAANTIFGVMAGSVLTGNVLASPSRRLWTLVVAGVGAVALGLALDPAVPIVKKIWTASFAIYSTGYTLLALALFYWICDVRQKTRWATMFLIIGANSIFIYLFHEIAGGVVGAVFRRGLGLFWDGSASKFVAAWFTIGVHVALCWILWRKKIFLRL